MKILPRVRSDTQRTFVAFLVAEIEYALDVMHILQIINPNNIDPLPYMPSAVLGVSDFRGTVVPVIDLRIRFGAPPRSSGKSKWLIARNGTSIGALIVDDVLEVFSAIPGDIRPPPRSGDEEVRALGGVLQHRKKMTFILDLPRLQPLLETIEHPGAMLESPSPAQGEIRRKERV